MSAREPSNARPAIPGATPSPALSPTPGPTPGVVGRIQQLWHYPVKSMVGQQTDSAIITRAGMLGDRGWIVRDEENNENTVVRTLPKLLLFAAEYVAPVKDNRIPDVRITFPDGSSAQSADPDINQRLSTALGKPVSLWSLQPKRHWQHYRLRSVMGSKDMKRMFASKDLPDFSSISWKLLSELMLFSTPLGRYYDVYPLHLITTGALQQMQQIEPEGDFGAHRFRPNIVIESQAGVTGFDDVAWVGGKLHIGDELVIAVESRTVRCSMPAQPQQGAGKDSRVLRAIDRHANRHFGVNATVIKAGTVNVGDQVSWQPVPRSALARGVQAVSGRAKNTVSHGLLNLVDRLLKP